VTNKGYYSYINNVKGVWYNNTRGQWAIFNQNLGNISVGISFNVTVLATDSAFFVQTATAGNTTDNSTFIDHPLTNNKPNTIVLVTPNWNPGGISGSYNDHPIGVWYSLNDQKWTIRNETVISIPEGASFNVIVMSHMVYLPLVMR
ncbi:MAG: hypothetical protein MUO62_04695, partial [Anaerolineales bacterium]|nr:hypothetical protein [Anaerolineales bacterium]